MANFANPQEDTNVLRLVLASGSVALPSIVFANDVTKGLHWDIDGLHLTGLAVPTNDGDAANKAYVDASAGGVTYPLTAPDGSAGAPSYSFVSHPDMGMLVATGTLAFSVAGNIGGYFSGSEFQITQNNDLLMNEGAPIDTTSTNGFLQVSTCAGAPTGVPGAGNGCLIYDTTNDTLYVYNGSWKSVTLS